MHSLTDKGGLQYSNTYPTVQFFTDAPSLRNRAIKNPEILINLFISAYNFDKNTAVKLMLWLRDPRNGNGEKNSSKILLKFLIENNGAQFILDNIDYIFLELSSFKDAVEFADNPIIGEDVIKCHCRHFLNGNRLAAKFMPRFNGKNDKLAYKYRDILGYTNSEYRTMIKLHSDTVEQKMCSKNFFNIDYSTVPSIAMKKYSKAFKRNDSKRFQDFINNKLIKTNSSVLYPHQIIKMAINGESDIAQKLWDNLPNYIPEGKSILPIVDVSSSMWWEESKVADKLYAGDIALSLAVYLSQRLFGPFRNTIMEFSDESNICSLPDGNLSKIIDYLQFMHINGSTNFESVYTQLLKFATMFNVKPEQMPDMLIVFSDMQFDSCIKPVTHLDNMRAMFKKKGYKLPKIIFWQLNTSLNGNPAKFNDDGIGLVGGFSINLMKAILSMEDKDFTPELLMHEAISYLDNLNFNNLPNRLSYVSAEGCTDICTNDEL